MSSLTARTQSPEAGQHRVVGGAPLRSSLIFLVHINVPSMSGASAEPRSFDLLRAIASTRTFSLLLRRLGWPTRSIEKDRTAPGVGRICRAVVESACGAPS